jgi:phosphonate degradation associated HDIG domain protein
VIDGVDHVLSLLRMRGHACYGGEAVTQIEHALQCATLAEEAGASAHLIAAALLHDIGHLLEEMEATTGAHEVLGARYLAPWFVTAVCGPVRLHVDAKRYLCYAEPGYPNLLSPESRRTLELQGGPMSPWEAERFLATPWARDAVALRRWDDRAKVVGISVPGLAYFRAHVESGLRRVGA